MYRNPQEIREVYLKICDEKILTHRDTQIILDVMQDRVEKEFPHKSSAERPCCGNKECDK